MIDKGIRIPGTTFPSLFTLPKKTLVLENILGIQSKKGFPNEYIIISKKHPSIPGTRSG
jgi:hypothetical protein